MLQEQLFQLPCSLSMLEQFRVSNPLPCQQRKRLFPKPVDVLLLRLPDHLEIAISRQSEKPAMETFGVASGQAAQLVATQEAMLQQEPKDVKVTLRDGKCAEEQARMGLLTRSMGVCILGVLHGCHLLWTPPVRRQCPATLNLVAIDIAKQWNVALIQEASGRRRSFKFANSGADHQQFVQYLHSLRGPVRVGLEPTGDYHRNIAYRLLTEGFEVVSISSLALARMREARFPFPSSEIVLRFGRFSGIRSKVKGIPIGKAVGTIGLDTAKQVFQMHGADASGRRCAT